MLVASCKTNVVLLCTWDRCPLRNIVFPFLLLRRSMFSLLYTARGSAVHLMVARDTLVLTDLNVFKLVALEIQTLIHAPPKEDVP